MLDVLDYLVDKGNMNIWSSISSKKFFQSLLDLLRTRDIPEVQMKLLGLIQKWGLNFEDKRSALPNFYSVYNKLRNSNVQFPNDFESNYQKYISNSSSNNHKKSNNYENRNDDYENENENENSDKDDGETFIYMDSLKNKLKVPNFEHKYRRLVNFLVKMHDNIQMANLLMDSRERSGLKDIINTLREGNNTLIDTISGGRLKDEKLMEITLGTTEDINQTLNRDEDIKNGYKPKKFTSYFVLNNVIPIKGNNNYRTRAKSTKPKKSAQRRDEKYKNYDMDLSGYNQNKYKEKVNAPKNVDDIFDLFSASNPSNEPGYNQQQNNQPINSFFSSQTQIRGNNNNNQYPQLRNNPMTNLFNNNNNVNNRNNNNMNFSTNFQSNNPNNNNFGRQFNQNNNQQRPVMTNFDILEQKLNNLNFEQNNNNNFNFNSRSTQINRGFNNNNMSNNNNMNNSNNNNLMNMLDQLGPVPQGDTNQLVPYIGNFNQNNNNNMNNNNFMNNNNNNNSQFNNFNNNNNNNTQFNNFNNNNNNTRYSNNQFSNSNNFNNNINQSTNFNNSNNNQFNNNQSNFGSNNNDRNMFNTPNDNNQMNFDTNLGRNQNMNDNNNFGIGQNDNQQMNLEELEKQRKLKELDDLF